MFSAVAAMRSPSVELMVLSADCIISSVVVVFCRVRVAKLCASAASAARVALLCCSGSATLGSAELLLVDVDEELMVTASELVISEGCSGVMARSIWDGLSKQRRN